MDLKIQGRTALITGATGGIGHAAARLLLEEGAHLILSDLEQDDLEEAADQLDADDDRLQLLAADLSSAEGAEQLRREARRHVDIVVHTTGVTGAKGDPLEDIEEDDWEEAWQIDFMSSVRVARAFVPAMADRSWGRVVYVTSENATQPYPEEVVYNAAKAALLSFLKGTAQVYAPKGVLINAVSPAFIETDMTDKMMEKRAQERGTSKEEAIASFLEEERPNLVLDRRGRPDEVAAVIAMLCSERASFVVGSNWRVDGGSVLAIDV